MAKEMSLVEIEQVTPEDVELIRLLANSRAFFYDGPGVIMPSGRQLTGQRMRELIAEAGYNPLTREHKPFPPPEPEV